MSKQAADESVDHDSQRAEEGTAESETHVESEGQAESADNSDQTLDIGEAASTSDRLMLGIRGRRVALGAAALVLVVATAVVCWMAHGERVQDDRAADAQKEVGTSLVRLLSWTPSSVVSELDDEKLLLTGDFADDYAELVRQSIGPAARESGLSSKAQISASGVISQDGDKIELLFFVNVTVGGKGQQDDTVGSRIQVTAVEKDGKWLIEKYDPI
jgi:Mce-associated membrane protein